MVTPPLLGGGSGVEPVVALLEISDDALAVVHGIGVVVFELGLHAQHRQPRTANPGEHPPGGVCADGDGGVAAFGLEVAELGGEDLHFALGVVDNRGSADELHGRVVAGRHAQVRVAAGVGVPGRLDVDVDVGEGEHDVRVALGQRPGKTAEYAA